MPSAENETVVPVLLTDRDTMEERAAAETEPFEAVLLTCPAGVFDNKPGGARYRALRRVAQMWGQQKHLPFADRHVIYPARFGDFQDHVAS
jgi:hypothetical protein